MKLTIGMACYGEFNDVWFTVQALKAYHDLTDCEILVVDNKGDTRLKDWVRAWGHGLVRYEKCTEVTGTTYPRQKVFELAKGDFVICIDSHVLIKPGFIDHIPYDSTDLIHGAMIYDSGMTYVTHMEPKWNCNMYGVWGQAVTALPEEPFEIPMHGLGLFGSRKDSWLGFNDQFKGFGGEEGYIHRKYKNAGRKSICVPQIQWYHRFRENDVPYNLDVKDRIRNYLIGFEEVGMSVRPVHKHFGETICRRLHENTPDR